MKDDKIRRGEYLTKDDIQKLDLFVGLVMVVFLLGCEIIRVIVNDDLPGRSNLLVGKYCTRKYRQHEPDAHEIRQYISISLQFQG